MRILFLNWRCLRHPKAGGAELVTHRIAERLVGWGHDVTLFTASFPGAPAEQEIDGVSVIRRGGQLSVHWEAAKWYRQQDQGAFDVVIDEINTIPFFAPLYARTPVVGFIHQLAREVWWYEAPKPLAAIGYLLEPLYLRAYRDVPVITVSGSTAKDLERLRHRSTVHIIPEAIDLKPLDSLDDSDKESTPTMIHLGRLAPSKRIAHAIQALAILHAQGIPEAQLWVVGRGDLSELERLERLVDDLDLRDTVCFWGAVSAEEKAMLLQRAHVLVACSVREGWGLVVTEANAMGTPAVVYDVPGLRDSTRHTETGIVCTENSPSCLALNVKKVLTKAHFYSQLRRTAWEWSKTFSWEATAMAFASVLTTPNSS